MCLAGRSDWTIIDILEETFTLETYTEISSNLLSASLFDATLFVPTWTAKLVGSVDLGNIVSGMGRATLAVGKSLT